MAVKLVVLSTINIFVHLWAFLSCHEIYRVCPRQDGIIVFSNESLLCLPSSLYYDEDGDLAHEFYEETVVTKNGRKKAKLKRIQKNLIPQVWDHFVCLFQVFPCLNLTLMTSRLDKPVNLLAYPSLIHCSIISPYLHPFMSLVRLQGTNDSVIHPFSFAGNRQAGSPLHPRRFSSCHL